MQNAWIVAGLSAIALTACGGGNAEDAATAPTTTPETHAAATESSEQHTEAQARVTPVPEGSLAANPMIVGSTDAPLSIVEYASVTCPHCADFHESGWPLLEELLVKPNLASFEYREFPTAPTNLAYAGFYLARCTATEKGPDAYFKVVKSLYNRQYELVQGPEPGELLANIAAQAGIDREGFQACFYREDIKKAVSSNIETGLSDGVRGTPSFSIDDETVIWNNGTVLMLHAAEKKLAKEGHAGIPAGATKTVTVAYPIAMCNAVLKATEKSLSGSFTWITDEETAQAVDVRVADGGKLAVSCAAESKDATEHTLTVTKVAAE